MIQQLRPVLASVAAALVVAAVSLALRNDVGAGNTLEVAERWTLDWRFRMRGPRAPGQELALLLFDDATAERGGPLYERRLGWARVIEAANAAGAKVIGVDATFDEPERLLGAELGARIAVWHAEHPDAGIAEPAEGLLTEVAEELSGDQVLEGAIAGAGDVVLILVAGDGAAGGAADVSVAHARYAQSTPGLVPPAEVQRVSGSLPALNHAAKGLGFANVRPDETETMRWVALAQTWQGGVYFPFAVPVVANFLGVSRSRVAFLGPQRQLRLADRVVPLDDNGLWLNYRGPAASFPTFPVLDLIDGKLPKEALAGKIVLIGVSRQGFDRARTPFMAMPGVEVQATLIDNLLHGDPLRRSTREEDLLCVFGLGAAIALLFAFRSLRPAGQVAGAVLLTAAWYGGSAWAFSHHALWLPWVGPFLVAIVCSGIGLTLSYSAEVRNRRYLRKAFASYLSEDVLRELIATGEQPKLGGERRLLTVVFSDICGFTALSERLSPEQLVGFLNTYLSPMTRAVHQQGGMLDKYIGDAVMAVFGALGRREDHPRQALQCAIQMHRELATLNAGPLKQLGLNLAIGVGINTGEMVVGNMGSEEHFDYTVAGDSVNLASRLEGLTRTYDVFCLVSEATRTGAGPGFTFRALDLVQVKGKHEVVEIHELLSGPGGEVARRQALPAWERALTAWRSGQLPQARAAFAEFARDNPGDPVVARYLERLAALPETAPEGFSPVTIFSSK